VKTDELFNRIKECWFATSNENLRGEHPEYSVFSDELAKSLSCLSDDELLEFIQSLSAEEIKLCNWAIDDLVNDYEKDFLKAYL